MKKIIQPILIIAIFVLGYLIVESIMRPIRFKRQAAERERAVITKLEDIREAQKAYKDVYKRYTGSFDTLEMFLRNDSFTVTKAIGQIPEEWLEELGLEEARQKAIEEGVIVRETTKRQVLDSLFGKAYPVDSMKYVPYTNQIEFDIESSEVLTSSNLMVQVVEVKAYYEDLLKGLNEQLAINYIDQKETMTGFPGIKFGSLEEGTLSGNWE
ncbi:MAG: hypothetical protein P1P82_00720 [Bacteroidales bacterium]|nr:hypothetical protein [Bacteroidales bacterium]MDT8430079.1 hypothetical protein [Bacteroidales bacterium]